jgi:hypothetical protein
MHSVSSKGIQQVLNFLTFNFVRSGVGIKEMPVAVVFDHAINFRFFCFERPQEGARKRSNLRFLLY